MINKIRNDLLNKMDKVLNFRYNGTRNQIEEFKGIITEIYNSIFIVKIVDKEEVRSFTYSDILIGNLEIYN